jgi:hypothetical protein
VADNFNGDIITRLVAGTLGFPQEALRSAKEIKTMREGRAQQQQAMMQMQLQQQQEQHGMGMAESAVKLRKEVDNG